MPDYKEMYQKMAVASEKAIRILIQAQQECEELYINALEPELRLLTGEKGERGKDQEPQNG